MKQFIALIFAILLVFSAVSCAGGDVPDESAETTAAETLPETEATVAPEIEIETAPATEKKGCGSVIGGAFVLVAMLSVALVAKKKD